MNFRMLRRFTLLTTALVLVGCDKPTLYVESNTAWTGRVGGSDAQYSAEVQGEGNKVYELRSGTTCWEFRKLTADGTLRAYATKRGNRTEGDDKTTQPFGQIAGCV